MKLRKVIHHFVTNPLIQNFDKLLIIFFYQNKNNIAHYFFVKIELDKANDGVIRCGVNQRRQREKSSCVARNISC